MSKSRLKNSIKLIILIIPLLCMTGCGGGGNGDGADETDENNNVNVAEEQQPYESQPVVSGETAYEMSEGITIPNETFVINLSDGTKVDIPAIDGEIDISLERKSNTLDLEDRGMQTTGSMRVFSFSPPPNPDNPAEFLPSITIPAEDAGNIDPDTINMLRVGDCIVDGELVTDHYSFLPVHRDDDGNYVAIDTMMLITAHQENDRIASAEAYDLSDQILPNKVKYSLLTFQENLNWGRSPLLMRMLPDEMSPGKRKPAEGQNDVDLQAPIINVVLLVHGHNEEEYAGFKDSTLFEPWGVSYKRDVWTYLYDTFLFLHSQKEDCTFFYEYIYPTYRPAITRTGNKVTLGESLGKLLENDPLLKQLLDDNTPFNFFIVAHSMGGLVARAGLRFMDSPLLANFKKLVTWGTPHHGSPLVTLRYVLGARPGYLLGPGRIYFDTTAITADHLYQLVLDEKLQLDTPGTRDLRWDGGIGSDPFKLTLSQYLQESPDQLEEVNKFSLENGSWLYNHNLRAFNENDPYKMSDKYAFLYGMTTKRVTIEEYDAFYKIRYFKTPEQTAIGATVIEKLIDEGDTIEPTYGDLLRGDSDGAVPLFSASGKGIVGPYPPEAVYIGDIDHEEYFGSPKDGQFNAIILAQRTAEETFKALGFNTGEYDCQNECYWFGAPVPEYCSMSGSGYIEIDTNNNPDDDTYVYCSYYNEDWGPYSGTLNYEIPRKNGLDHGIVKFYLEGQLADFNLYRDGVLIDYCD